MQSRAGGPRGLGSRPSLLAVRRGSTGPWPSLWDPVEGRRRGGGGAGRGCGAGGVAADLSRDPVPVRARGGRDPVPVGFFFLLSLADWTKAPKTWRFKRF